MVSALDRKLLRDLSRLKGQVITIALVVAAGIAAFVAMKGNYVSLEHARDSYYERSRFADVFAHLERAGETKKVALSPAKAKVPAGTDAVECEVSAGADTNNAKWRASQDGPLRPAQGWREVARRGVAPGATRRQLHRSPALLRQQGQDNRR